jgi:hypothetical protein
VADYLQERVFDNGPQLRLDAQKLLFRNAFDSAIKAKLNFTSFTSSVVETQRVSLSQQLKEFHPPVVFTFGDEAYRFVSFANPPDKPVPGHSLKIEDLGKRFRDVCEKFDPKKVNISRCCMHPSHEQAGLLSEKGSPGLTRRTITSGMWDKSSAICC